MEATQAFASEMEKWGANIAAPKNVSTADQSIEPLYIVAIKMSSPNRILQSRKIRDRVYEQTMAFSEEKRREIGAVRSRHGAPVRGTMVDFFHLGVYIAKESQLEEIRHRINVVADGEMKAIDSTLSAGVTCFPIDSNASRQSEIYDKLVASIRGQIYNDLIPRLHQVIKQNRKNMLPKSKESLLNQIAKFRTINVVNDPEIERELARFEQIVHSELIEPLAQEIDASMQVLSTRWGYMRDE